MGFILSTRRMLLLARWVIFTYDFDSSLQRLIMIVFFPSSQLASHTLNYKYTAPLPELQQETRDKHAFGLDVRGRMMLLPISPASESNVMDTSDESKDTWDVLAEKLSKDYGVPN